MELIEAATEQDERPQLDLADIADSRPESARHISCEPPMSADVGVSGRPARLTRANARA